MKDRLGGVQEMVVDASTSAGAVRKALSKNPNLIPYEVPTPTRDPDWDSEVVDDGGPCEGNGSAASSTPETKWSVEGAFEISSAAAHQAIERCRARLGTYPDLRCSRHFQAVGKTLDVRREVRRYPAISPYDFAYALIRQIAQGAPYSPLRDLPHLDRDAIVAAIFGRVYYNPPPREFEYRRERLLPLLHSRREERFGDAIGVLADLLHEMNHSVESAVAQGKSTRRQLMDWYSNPLIWTKSRLRRHCLEGNKGLRGLDKCYAQAAATADWSTAFYR